MKFKELILTSAIIFSSLTASIVFADTVPLDYEGSIQKMQQLGVMDKAKNGEESVVTKGELVKAIAIADGLASTCTNLNGTTIFSDITANSELSGYVNGVVGIGLMFGMPDGNFHPEQTVTIAEVDTIMVRLLGYTDTDPDLAKLAWPNNYIQEAYNLELTTDMLLKKNDKLTYKVEAVLFDRLFNTLVKGSTTKYFSDSYFKDQYLNTDITGTLKEVEVIGNSKTSDKLNDNQVFLAINGVPSTNAYTLNDNAGKLELGVKYKLYIDGNNITRVSVTVNIAEDYAITTVAGSDLGYENANNVISTMKLPQAALYYYHGASVDYDVAVKAIRTYSSIILAKKSDNSGYDYAVIIDPDFGEPQVYKTDNTKLLEKLKTTKYTYIYRQTTSTEGNIEEADLMAYDVVYFVSDIWKKNTFVYVNEQNISGTVTDFVPDIYNPTGLTINKVNYNFDKYFNKARINNYDGNIGNFLTNVRVNDFETLVLGIDGNIVDIY